MEVEAVYIGTREAMIAEVAAFDPTGIGERAASCRYLVMPVGRAQFDTNWTRTKADALACAREAADAYGVKIVWVG